MLLNRRNEFERWYHSADQVEKAFYKAFGSGDFDLMETLFADCGVICKHPENPTIIGRTDVLANWKCILTDIPQEKIEVEILNITKTKSIEIHHVKESYVINTKTGCKSEVYTTNVYFYQPNGWRLLTQHSSLERKISATKGDKLDWSVDKQKKPCSFVSNINGD